MTAYEIISVFMGILALVMSFGSLIIALLVFLEKKNYFDSNYLKNNCHIGNGFFAIVILKIYFQIVNHTMLWYTMTNKKGRK